MFPLSRGNKGKDHLALQLDSPNPTELALILPNTAGSLLSFIPVTATWTSEMGATIVLLPCFVSAVKLGTIGNATWSR